MNYYRVKTGYGSDEFTSISEHDLHKVLYLFLCDGGRTILENGQPLRGQDIMDVKPDIHKLMSWNRGYKPLPEDYGDATSVLKRAEKKLVEARALASYIQSSGNHELLRLPMVQAQAQMQGLIGDGQLLAVGSGWTPNTVYET
jgi:hypothetical protein